MSSVKLLILAAVLAVIANARVAVLPGWVVPLPAVILAAELAAVAAVAALVALRFWSACVPSPSAPAPVPAPARRVIAGEVAR